MARRFLRRATKTLVVILNLTIVVLFLLACLSPFLNTANWWMIGFTGLIVPYLIIGLIFFIIFWLIVKPKLALVSVAALLIGFQQVNVVFAWKPGPAVSERKREGLLRVISWNIQSFNGFTKDKKVRKLARTEVVESILKFEPDIVCLQEFNHKEGRDPESNNLSLFTKRYPYYHFSKDYVRDGGEYQSGCIIFSKYPIANTGKIKYPVAESLIYADILKGQDTIRVFTTHLQSFKFKEADYTDLEKIKDQDDEGLRASKNIVRKMRLAFKRRGVQAGIVRTELDKSPYASIICGDFNDVPNSYTYFHIKGTLQDAFLKKGFGIGRSFIALAPTLRIDYILAGPAFTVKMFDMVDEGLSDHIMLVSDLQLKK
ncbi:endonuclease/exonuclease/phosphatase family protein [Sediminibacterium goheungense]|uniref:Endonuclease/exonuclease/phosphatase family metal-dependent hydrolase n=1 Tax=Sediminibacterium goheungense TaxID=1086393 RepID=A0A4R6J4D6_9BACT|nr:endonuclease/exonuclease/phosphatase family protein [Sediminibacterium goheungense]TDO29156.1 endonuclease/exonuclease/phosphatase family metal-dependent hydrolase [Sediminibacterium goheungense]